MTKILATQLNGLFQKISKNEEEAIEQTARLLAQASVGDGHVYFATFGELQAIELHALLSMEPFYNLKKWSSDLQLSNVDRVLLFTQSCQNEEALKLARKLSEQFIPFAVVSSEAQEAQNELSDLAYTYISMHIRGGIVPHPTKLTERAVFPHLHAALFIYEAIKLIYDEMLEDLL